MEQDSEESFNLFLMRSDADADQFGLSLWFPVKVQTDILSHTSPPVNKA